MLNFIMLTACHLKSVECQPRRNSGIQTFERVYIIARVTNTFASPIQQYFFHMFIAVAFFAVCNLVRKF